MEIKPAVFDLVTLGNMLFTAAITGGVVFVLQKLFEARMNRNLEKFKSELQESHTRFATTYPRLLEIVDELQIKLIDVESIFAVVMRPVAQQKYPSSEETVTLIENVEKSIDTYLHFIEYIELRLPSGLAKTITDQRRQLLRTQLELASLRFDLKRPPAMTIGPKEWNLLSDWVSQFEDQAILIRQECRKLIEGETKSG